MARVLRTGAVAKLERCEPDVLEMRPEFFAELDDGRRITTDHCRHGGIAVSLRRKGIGAIYRRYYGSTPTDAELEDYRVGATDVVDAIKEMAGLLSWREYASNWSSLWTFTFNGGVGQTRDRRRLRWAALLRALDEAGVRASKRELDRLPFRIEIADELGAELRG